MNVQELRLPEIVLPTQFFLLLGRQGFEIATPAGAEIDLPTPKTSDERMWVLVVLST